MAEPDTHLVKWFNAVDEDKSGSVDAGELQRALQSAGLHFTVHTTAMMIRMYDRSRNGTINFHEFSHLHHFILSVQESFNVFDSNSDGVLDRDEIKKALSHNGFQLDEPSFSAVFCAFDPTRNNYLRLDEYIAMASFLSASKSMFSAFDFQRANRIQIDFSQFVYAASHLRTNRTKKNTKRRVPSVGWTGQLLEMRYGVQGDMRGGTASSWGSLSPVRSGTGTHTGSISDPQGQVTLWFRAVDKGGTGVLDAVQLQQAMASSGLVLSLQSAALMIRRFSRRRNGTLQLSEFKELYAFILSVRRSFDVFDVNDDQLLEFTDVRKALLKNNFILEREPLRALLRAFDGTAANSLNISGFIELATFLSAAEHMFLAFSDSQSGPTVTLDFCQFVYAIANIR